MLLIKILTVFHIQLHFVLTLWFDDFQEIEALNASLTGTPGQRKKSKPVVMFTGYEDPQVC